jgi:hypothetical protein
MLEDTLKIMSDDTFIPKGLIKNIKDVDVSSSEILTRASLNRNFLKLFDNDLKLISNTMSTSGNLYRVFPWEEGKVYSKNQLVWFVDFYLSPANADAYNKEFTDLETFLENTPENINKLKNKYYTTSLYLLRSLKNGNTNMPQRTLVDMIPVFDASGWKNENPLGSIYTDYFNEFTVYNLKNQLYKMHESVAKYHKFGELSSYKEIDNKVLKTDLSNIDPNREHVFFVNESYELDETNTILPESNVRIWDCGVIEYNIFFKLGDTTNSYATYNSDGSLNYSQYADANYIDLSNKDKVFNDYTYYNNRKYYLNDEDSDIFVIKGGYNISENNINQQNVNNFINSYTGTIKFPKPFIDTNYMIFNTNTPSSILYGNSDVVSNINNLVFINKSKDSVTALLIIPNYENNTTAKVLHNNVFKCNIIGRWK